MVDAARSLPACSDCDDLPPRPGTLRGCRLHGCAPCDALSSRAGAPVGCRLHAPDPTAEADGCPRCAQLAALLGAGVRCQAHVPPVAAADDVAPLPARPAPRPVAPTPSATPEPSSLSDHQLARLVAEVAPLAAVNTAAGARSVHPDPDRPRGGAAPDDTALDRACDSGVLGAARRAWTRWVTLPAAARATLLWVAEQGGALLDVDAAAPALARAQGPGELQQRYVDLTARCERADLTLVAMQKVARKGLTPEGARELDAAREHCAQLRKAREHAHAPLDGWGRTRLAWAYAAWFQEE